MTTLKNSNKRGFSLVELVIGIGLGIFVLTTGFYALSYLFKSSTHFTMKMKVERGFREIVLPASAAEPMRLKLTCEECSCRFAVIGSAFFCPSHG